MVSRNMLAEKKHHGFFYCWTLSSPVRLRVLVIQPLAKALHPLGQNRYRYQHHETHRCIVHGCQQLTFILKSDIMLPIWHLKRLQSSDALGVTGDLKGSENLSLILMKMAVSLTFSLKVKQSWLSKVSLTTSLTQNGIMQWKIGCNTVNEDLHVQTWAATSTLRKWKLSTHAHAWVCVVQLGP